MIMTGIVGLRASAVVVASAGAAFLTLLAAFEAVVDLLDERDLDDGIPDRD
jgi:hypothetical protein